MKIAIFARRCMAALAGAGLRNSRAPRVVRTQITPAIRVVSRAGRKGRGPVVRWRVSPVTGRLELHIVEHGDWPGEHGRFFERLGAILAVHQRSRR